MSNSQEQLKKIVESPKEYLAYEGKSLDARISEVKLNSQQEEQVKLQAVSEAAGGTIKTSLSILTGGLTDILFEAANWKKTVDKNMDDAKKALLLAEYFNKFDSIEAGVENLKRVTSDLHGQTLFSKIDHIAEDSPLDEEVIKRLGNVMKVISDEENFETIFTSAKQILNLIEKLSPFSLYMIGDYEHWPPFQMNMLMSFGNKVNEFESYFVEAYFQKNPSFDRNAIETAVSELSSSGLIWATQDAHSSGIRVFFTNTGEFLYKSIK